MHAVLQVLQESTAVYQIPVLQYGNHPAFQNSLLSQLPIDELINV